MSHDEIWDAMHGVNQPKPTTGEWTEERVRNLLLTRIGGGYGQLVKAINAALAAERENVAFWKRKAGEEFDAHCTLQQQLATMIQAIDILSMQDNAGKGRPLSEVTRRNQQALDTLRLSSDTTALDAAIAAAQKPLVEMLMRVLNSGQLRSDLESGVAAALAQVKAKP